jgi:hypothetical protein
MSIKDNFDYTIPTLTRNQTMYLQTINSSDAKIHPFKKLDTQRDWSANLYNLDIESSSPRRFGIFTNKTDFINKVDDIEKTNSKILHYPLNKPEYNLTNSDIEKSSPNMGHLKTNRCTNPLEPKYTLSKVENYPPEIPKFIRDQININDIEGTHPQKYFQWGTRETFPLDNHGIEGSKTKKKYVRNNIGQLKYHYLNYSDLTQEIFSSGRCTNPLDPIYNFKKENGEILKYGFIEKSKPQTNYPFYYPVPFGLKTDDIVGAQVGSKNKINAFNGMNFNLVNSDIRGCSVGSLKKGISTKRCTNPIYPKYPYLGAIELKNIQTKNLGRNMSGGINNWNGKNNTEEQKNFDNNGNINNNNIGKSNNINNNVNIINNNANVNNNFNKVNIEKKFNKTEYNNNLGFGNGYFDDKVEFNSDKYVKPNPYYGLIHDKYVKPSDNANNLAKIEKDKTIKKTQEIKTLTGNNFYNNTNNQLDQFNKTNNKNIYNNNSLMNTNNLNNALNNTTNNFMSKTGINNFGNNKGKMSYAQKLDDFMNNNNLKYIEPPKPPEPQPEPVVEEIVEPEVDKGKSNVKKGGKK